MQITIRFFILLVSLSVGVLPKTQAVIPPPDGGYPGGNTAEGQNALQSNTSGGFNSAVGYFSLFANTTAGFNTGVGAGTQILNTTDSNTAVGAAALLLNTTGPDNTAVGADTLVHNVAGDSNTAVGAEALEFNDGLSSDNTAVGAEALQFNTDGNPNTAVGYAALNNNLIARGNTAVGYDALLFNDQLAHGFPFGWYNNAVGAAALISNVDGYSNNAFATTRSSSMLTALQTPPLVITRSGIMTRMHSVWAITTRQLVLWRSSITLMVVRTQPWVKR